MQGCIKLRNIEFHEKYCKISVKGCSYTTKVSTDEVNNIKIRAG
jgi:hypothetical protein